MYCPSCGNRIDTNQSYCPNCGMEINRIPQNSSQKLDELIISPNKSYEFVETKKKKSPAAIMIAMIFFLGLGIFLLSRVSMLSNMMPMMRM